MSNGHQIGAFSEAPFSQTRQSRGKGYLMSITNKRIYDLKPKFEGKGITYDRFLLIFGQNELIIKSDMTFSVIFGMQYSHFTTGNDTIDKFIGQAEDKGKYKSIEFHQIITE